MKKKNEEITFKDILGVFMPKVWIILLVAILLASIFAFYSSVVVDDSYTTYSVMSVRKDTEALQLADIGLAESIIDIVSYRIQAPEFFNKVLLYVKKSYQGYDNLSLATISSSIKYTPLGNGVLRISVTTDNPQLSYAIAQALEVEVPNEFHSFLPNALKVEPYSSAFIPSANSKGVFTSLLIGFFSGAFLAAIVIWIYVAFDFVIKNKKKIEDNFDIPVIGVIPAVKANVSETEAV